MPSQLLTIYDCHGQKRCPTLEEINHKSNNYDGNDVHMENTPPLEGERKKLERYLTFRCEKKNKKSHV